MPLTPSASVRPTSIRVMRPAARLAVNGVDAATSTPAVSVWPSVAIATPLVYGRLGDLVGPNWAATAAAGTAFAVVPLMLLLAPHIKRTARRAT